MFARLEARAIQKLVEMDLEEAAVEADKRRANTNNQVLKAEIDASRFRAIYHIWPDFEISKMVASR